MSQRNRQQIFDVAYRGLRSQQFVRSISSGRHTTCMLRGKNDRKCAIGWLIPDELYHNDMEGSILNNTPQRLAANIKKRDAKFAEELQVVHDSSKGGLVLKLRLEAFATKHRLRVPE